jgi:hypothetical protein
MRPRGRRGLTGCRSKFGGSFFECGTEVGKFFIDLVGGVDGAAELGAEGFAESFAEAKDLGFCAAF